MFNIKLFELGTVKESQQVALWFIGQIDWIYIPTAL